MAVNKIILILSLCLFIACKNENPAKEAATSLVDSTTMETPIAKKVLPVKQKALPIPDYDTTQWTDMLLMDSSFVLDLKYATTENFVEEQLYTCPRCFLRPKAARVIMDLQKEFQEKGLGIKFFDCYRPLNVQRHLWNKVPDATYVTNPKKGSMHNRGLAVDLTLVDKNGVELDMGTDFDFFGREAHHTHTDHSKEVLDNRRLLKSTMEAAGFKSIRTEWWHYSLKSVSYEFSDWEWNCK